MRPYFIIPAFFVGKFISDAIAVLGGKYAAENTPSILEGAVSWKSILGIAIGLLLISALLFIDWRTLVQQKKFKINFKIWK